MPSEMIFIKGFIKSRDADVNPPFESFIPEGQSNKDVVLIFPGNTGHNRGAQKPYDIKRGGGLARVAEYIGEHGFPTLSLPTTGMPKQLDGPMDQRAVAAVADIWFAVGAGKQLALPVRDAMLGDNGTQTYFSGTLKDNLEPSFWGNFEPTPNRVLGDYYLEQLKKIMHHLSDPSKHLVPEDFLGAYHTGLDAKKRGVSDASLQRDNEKPIAMKRPKPLSPEVSAKLEQLCQKNLNELMLFAKRMNEENHELQWQPQDESTPRKSNR